MSGNMSIKINDIQMHVLNMHTRFPFKYGIASLVALPHLFVRVEAEVDGKRSIGLAADGLPPKWFTKNPEAPFSADLDEMLAVIRNAVRVASESGQADSVFDLWQGVYHEQKMWAEATAYPPLLWAFGVSLVERAAIDAFCRGTGRTFATAVRDGSLGIRLDAIHPELSGKSPADCLTATPLSDIRVRHTVGLADPLTGADISEDEKLTDGLPQSLEDNISVYGLTHLKIKLCGDADTDRARLKGIAALMKDRKCEFTLDGNEQYTELTPFRDLWEAIRSDSELTTFLEGLIFVEQPLHRDVALSDEAQSVLSNWDDCPPMIIDESDGALDSSRRALDCGYVGTSHKNCKGVFKGIANASLMAEREKASGRRHILSSEDLANVGPVALTQDLAVLATLGVTHSERNGHHYFAGLDMFPGNVQEQIAEHHGSLYRSNGSFLALAVSNGTLDISSVVDAPFGYAFDFDTTCFTPLDEWSSDSLEL
jgi:hypothetical protein